MSSVPARRTLSQRSETFGLGTADPWALPALRLLFSAPRVFEPLALAWDRRHSGTMKALTRLHEAGFVLHQHAVVLDTVAGRAASSPSRPVARFRLTASGARLLGDASSDSRVLSDMFARSNGSALARLERGMSAIASAPARFGLSARGFSFASGSSERVSREWLYRLEELGMVAQLPHHIPDVRPVAPQHWRPSSLLVRQISELLEDPSFALLSHLKAELGLARRRQLGDLQVDPASYRGTTDYDHDVNAQAVLARLISRTDVVPRSTTVRVEPSVPLLCRPAPGGFAVAREGASMRLSYRPDAEFRERGAARPARVALEYERMQTRRDAWTHIEKFVAMMHQEAFPFEAGVLRFVVDGPRRVASYRELASAFAAYVGRFPEAAPKNEMEIAVADSGALLAAEDPYGPDVWHSVAFSGSGASHMLVHSPEDSPYDDFFRRAR